MPYFFRSLQDLLKLWTKRTAIYKLISMCLAAFVWNWIKQQDMLNSIKTLHYECITVIILMRENMLFLPGLSSCGVGETFSTPDELDGSWILASPTDESSTPDT
jgi:hypothetical protein